MHFLFSLCGWGSCAGQTKREKRCRNQVYLLTHLSFFCFSILMQSGIFCVWVCLECFAPPVIQDFSIKCGHRFLSWWKWFFYMIMHRYVRHVLSTMQRKDMEEIMKSHPRCFSLLELAIFIGKKGTHHLLQVSGTKPVAFFDKANTLKPTALECCICRFRV